LQEHEVARPVDLRDPEPAAAILLGGEVLVFQQLLADLLVGLLWVDVALLAFLGGLAVFRLLLRVLLRDKVDFLEALELGAFGVLRLLLDLGDLCLQAHRVRDLLADDVFAVAIAVDVIPVAIREASGENGIRRAYEYSRRVYFLSLGRDIIVMKNSDV